MSLPYVSTDLPTALERKHRTQLAIAVNELIKVRPPNDTNEIEVSLGIVPINTTYPVGDIRRYGGSESESAFADLAAFRDNNRAALQTAISVVASSTGVVIVPPGCDYGYDLSDNTTWPDFSALSSTSSNVVVIDRSRGATYAAPAKDGAQERYFYHTVQTASPGQHDGNGERLIGDWAPYYWIDNNYDMSGARTANDNRRASLFFGRNGVAAWRFGMGTLSSSTATDNELSSLGIDIFDGPLAGTTPLVLSLVTGNWNFGTSSNGLNASYWFKSMVTGYYQALFESLTTTSQIYLRTSNGSGDDAGLRNVAGDLSLNIVALGDALTVTKSNRRVTINQSLALKRTAVTYSASMTIDAATGNWFLISATNGSAFTINAPTNAADGACITITVKNESGGALGAVTWNGIFKMSAWTSPANGFNRSISFMYDGTASAWFQVSQTGVDVPN